VTSALSSELLVLGGLADDVAEGARRVERALASGAAAERFARMIAALGGPSDLVEAPDRHLARAPVRVPVFAEHAGTITAIDARAIGHIVVGLGGGRRRAEDSIDTAVGVADVRDVGERVGADQPLAIIHARSAAAAEGAATRLRGAVTIADVPPASPGPPVLRRMGSTR